eukprot:11806885-Heterocapsa_arctica.AAC.1
MSRAAPPLPGVPAARPGGRRGDEDGREQWGSMSLANVVLRLLSADPSSVWEQPLYGLSLSLNKSKSK